MNTKKRLIVMTILIAILTAITCFGQTPNDTAFLRTVAGKKILMTAKIPNAADLVVEVMRFGENGTTAIIDEMTLLFVSNNSKDTGTYTVDGNSLTIKIRGTKVVSITAEDDEGEDLDILKAMTEQIKGDNNNNKAMKITYTIQ